MSEGIEFVQEKEKCPNCGKYDYLTVMPFGFHGFLCNECATNMFYTVYMECPTCYGFKDKEEVRQYYER